LGRHHIGENGWDPGIMDPGIAIPSRGGLKF